jgi:hypothetical protein
MMALRKASRRSACRLTNGMASMRATSGAASTRPIMPASSPLAFSQSGKNGSCMPTPMNMAA